MKALENTVEKENMFVSSIFSPFKLDQSTVLWFGKVLTLSHTMTPFHALGNMPFENTVGKGEIARNEQFLFFPVFSTHLGNFLPFLSNLKLSSANSFSLEESKFCHLVKG